MRGAYAGATGNANASLPHLRNRRSTRSTPLTPATAQTRTSPAPHAPQTHALAPGQAYGRAPHAVGGCRPCRPLPLPASPQRSDRRRQRQRQRSAKHACDDSTPHMLIDRRVHNMDDYRFARHGSPRSSAPDSREWGRHREASSAVMRHETATTPEQRRRHHSLDDASTSLEVSDSQRLCFAVSC